MARKLRIGVVSALVVATLIVTALGAVYYAATQVQPFYEEALLLEPEAVEQDSRELESRASVLYSDVKQIGQWKALFTAKQINSWFAKQQAADKSGQLQNNFRDPRIAVKRDHLSVGLRTHLSGVETVIAIDASVLLTDDGAVGVRLLAARAGALPVPVNQAAELIAGLCRKKKAPVRWTQQQGLPVAIIKIANNTSAENREFFIDSLELRDGEMYVAGHTEVAGGQRAPKIAKSGHGKAKDIAIDDYELNLTPNDEKSALEIARRQPDATVESESATTR